MKKIIISIILMLFLCVSCSAPSDRPSSISQNERIVQLNSAVFAPYSVTLKSGYYIIGMDIPAGIYNISAVKGMGNLICLDAGINEMMSSWPEEHFIQKYNNANLEFGQILEVLGITIKIESEAADKANMVERENPAKSTVIFESGEYVAGRDFTGGAYDIIAKEGYGNVYSDNNDRGINAVMSDKEEDFSVTEYNNVLLDDGTTLTVSGVKIVLRPSD